MKTKEQVEKETTERKAKQAEADAAHQAAMVDKLTRNSGDLQTQVFEELRWIVPDYLPEGLAMLAGRPKVGKSWLALDIASAVAGGGTVLGKQVEPGDVLLLALEDTDRRLQRRMTKVLGAHKQDWPKFTYATQWPKLSDTDGGIDFLRAWIKKVAKPRLIIVDVLERVRDRGKQQQSQNQYAGDYDALKRLHELAAEFQLSVLVLHHQRKAAADDLMDTVSGTLGIGGALDSVLVLGRDDDSHFLYGRGRDLEEFTIAVKLDDHCRWENLGPKTERMASEAREQLVEAMVKHGGQMRLDEIEIALGRPKESFKMLLSRMCRDGELQRVGRAGTYRLVAAQAGLPIVGPTGQEVL